MSQFLRQASILVKLYVRLTDCTPPLLSINAAFLTDNLNVRFAWTEMSILYSCWETTTSHLKCPVGVINKIMNELVKFIIPHLLTYDYIEGRELIPNSDFFNSDNTNVTLLQVFY